jgi:hypothetical protein
MTRIVTEGQQLLYSKMRRKVTSKAGLQKLIRACIAWSESREKRLKNTIEVERMRRRDLAGLLDHVASGRLGHTLIDN